MPGASSHLCGVRILFGAVKGKTLSIQSGYWDGLDCLEAPGLTKLSCKKIF